MSFNNDLIITAMDRFVWFVLLVVTTHLVTELTRVTGYTRSNRKDVNSVNDSLSVPVNVGNLIRVPDQDSEVFEQMDYSNKNTNKKKEGETIDGNNNEHGISFSIRPLIDNTFKLPISMLHVVHNLFSRLASNRQQQRQQQEVDSGDGSQKLIHRGFQAMTSTADTTTKEAAEAAATATEAAASTSISSSQKLTRIALPRNPLLLRERSA